MDGLRWLDAGSAPAPVLERDFIVRFLLARSDCLPRHDPMMRLQ
jgi:hypothetical protein